MNITLETAADKLVKEIFGVKSGETVIITAEKTVRKMQVHMLW